MSWVIVGVAAAGAFMGYQKQKREEEIEDADKKLQSEMIKYSWVDGAQKGDPGAIRRAGSMMGNVGQGALSGAMFGSQFGGGGGDKGLLSQTKSTGGTLNTGAQSSSWDRMMNEDRYNMDNDKWRRGYA